MVKREIIKALEQHKYTNIKQEGKYIISTNPIGDSRIFMFGNLSENNPILKERGIEIYNVTPTGLEYVEFDNLANIKAVRKDISLEKDGKVIIIKITDYFFQPTEEQIKLIDEAYRD